MSNHHHRVPIGSTDFYRPQEPQHPALDRIVADLQIPLEKIDVIRLYDIFNLPEAALDTVIRWTLSDPGIRGPLAALPPCDYSFAYEYLPGQFDQCADSAAICIGLTVPEARAVRVQTSKILCFHSARPLKEEEKAALKRFFINPLSEREKDLNAVPELHGAGASPETVRHYANFRDWSEDERENWRREQGLALTGADLALVQQYFQGQGRDPTETEIKILDTYWSDHCRHSTFATVLEEVQFPASPFGRQLQHSFAEFVKANGKDNCCLMDLATIDARVRRRRGQLPDVEFSPEINACSVFVEVDEDGERRPWLLQFKNETHNHPTEIEPYGGASTCIGGAIRDPLAGRAYVYQACRLSGSGDPREPIAQTLPGKLPQLVIAQGSALGASSYGNQIGLATGQVREFYHPGYKAKHMELGAVVGAVPVEHVRRREPRPGDLVLLLGGLTGRDGCGGATGSSKAQHQSSLTVSAAEVQNGNAPEERKLQRLFSKKEFAEKIRRCNDFGAGGVSVAVGELAAGLNIDLDQIPVKYQGLGPTELAISESQERMAIVIDPKDEAAIKALAAAENLNATVIAEVSAAETLTMRWRGQPVVHLQRSFLDSNGARAVQKGVAVADFNPRPDYFADGSWPENLKQLLADPNHADQQGLGDRFDHSVGAGSVLLPYGGQWQRSPSEASVYLLPTRGATSTASILAYGFNVAESAANPYLGAYLAVVEATARLVACGGGRAHYSLQEYFPRLATEPQRWGQALAALLGAHDALQGLESCAIGGKDSMSGSFNDLHVPPTLVAFAVGTVNVEQVRSPEFKRAGDRLYRLRCPSDEFGRPDLAIFQANNEFLRQHNGQLQSIRAIRAGGLALALYECALGNGLGVNVRAAELFRPEYGGYLISSRDELPAFGNLQYLGEVSAEGTLTINGASAPLAELYGQARATLAGVYELFAPADTRPAPTLATQSQPLRLPSLKRAQPRVCLPVFFGMNSELDTARAFRNAGALVQESVFCQRPGTNDLEESLQRLEKTIDNSEIFVLCGGFSAGDEPDGSAKFIVNVLNSPRLREALERFRARDGLMLGICNGFQALLKGGFFDTATGEVATLVHNRIGRHVSRLATTVVSNNHSPWLRDFAIGQGHEVEFSHGEGQFLASAAQLQRFIDRGQIAFQYADPQTLQPSYDVRFNPNGSLLAVEGLISADGRILGKMGHSERQRANTHRNFPQLRRQDIFSQGVRAFQ